MGIGSDSSVPDAARADSTITRASAGALTLAVRGVIVRALAIVSLLVVAALLGTAEFGAAALALVGGGDGGASFPFVLH